MSEQNVRSASQQIQQAEARLREIAETMASLEISRNRMELIISTATTAAARAPGAGKAVAGAIIAAASANLSRIIAQQNTLLREEANLKTSLEALRRATAGSAGSGAAASTDSLSRLTDSLVRETEELRGKLEREARRRAQPPVLPPLVRDPTRSSRTGLRPLSAPRAAAPAGVATSEATAPYDPYDPAIESIEMTTAPPSEPPPLPSRQLPPELLAKLSTWAVTPPAPAKRPPLIDFDNVDVTWKGIRDAALTKLPEALLTGKDKGAAVHAVATTAGKSVVDQVFGKMGGDSGLLKNMTGALGSLVSGFVPIIGSLVGPAISGIVNLFHKPEWKKVMNDVGRDWGVKLSDGVAKAIGEDSKKFGDRRTAEIFNLDQILTEAGGLTDKNVDQFTAKLRDVFVHYERGALSAAQATQVLDKNFKAFAEYFTKTDSLVSPQFLELMSLAERDGLESTAINEHVQGQTSRALSGVDAFLGSSPFAVTAGAGDALAGVVAGAFAELTEHGLGAVAAFEQIDPVLMKLEEHFAAVGLQGSSALDSLRAMAVVAHDEVAGPALTAVSALDEVLKGVHNSGYMNQEMFSGLASQVTATFESLVAQGQNADVLMQMMAPTLQTLWEMQQNFGYQVDESTQALLNQAIEAGRVGEAHMTAQEQATRAMSDAAVAMQQVADVLSGAFDAMGMDGQAVVDRLNGAVGTIPRDIDITVRGHYVAPDIPGGADAESFHDGGMVAPRAHDGWMVVPGGLRPDEVPAVLQTGEGVLSRRAVALLGGPDAIGELNAMGKHGVRGGAGTSVAGDIYVLIDPVGGSARRLGYAEFKQIEAAAHDGLITIPVRAQAARAR